MTEKQYRLNKWGTKLLKNNRPLFDWANESDEIVDLLNKFNEENEELKQMVSFYKDFQKDARELEKENEQLKVTRMTKRDKSCGNCKHFQIDGMFGIWCDKGRKWENTNKNYCSDYER